MANNDPQHDMIATPVAASPPVTLENWLQAPQSRWAFRNVRRLLPTAEISRGTAPVFALPARPEPLGSLEFIRSDGDSRTVSAWLDASHTDGMLILHRGNIVFEDYRQGLAPRHQHILFSISKSILGMLAGILIGRGLFDREDRVSSFVPELAQSGWGDATVAHVLDMTTAADFVEDYDDPKASVWAVRRILYRLPDETGLQPLQSVLDYLPTVGRRGSHGDLFTYKSADTMVLEWIIERTTGRELPRLIETEIWSKLGAERDAYVMLDAKGVAYGAGGVCATLRDVGRFGLMVMNGGAVGGVQIVPEAWVRDSRSGDKQAFRQSTLADRFPNGAYKNQWWIKDADAGIPLAIGIHGQLIYIDCDKEMVGVKFSSWPAARLPDVLRDTVSAFEAIAASL